MPKRNISRESLSEVLCSKEKDNMITEKKKNYDIFNEER